MVERAVGPECGVVARRALRHSEGRPGGGVRGIIRLLPGGEVAAGITAIRRCDIQSVVVIHMALCARGDLTSRCQLVRVSKWESRAGVIKGRVGPVACVVALRALRSGESGVDVIGHVAAERLRFVPVRGVAAVAIRVRGGERVVIVGMAACARCRGMHTSEGPAGRCVIEGSHVGPGNGVVACGTLAHGECRTGRGMRGIIRLLPGSEVATGIAAIRGRDIQRVVVVDVALRAIRYFAGGRELVRVGEREAGGGVIERGVRPGRCVVALRTLRSGKSGGHMVRYVAAQRLRLVPIRSVAAVAIGGRQRIVVVHMALRARRRGMYSCQRETGSRVVE